MREYAFLTQSQAFQIAKQFGLRAWPEETKLPIQVRELDRERGRWPMPGDHLNMHLGDELRDITHWTPPGGRDVDEADRSDCRWLIRRPLSLARLRGLKHDVQPAEKWCLRLRGDEVSNGWNVTPGDVAHRLPRAGPSHSNAQRLTVHDQALRIRDGAMHALDALHDADNASEEHDGQDKQRRAV
ncbi:hypothetical protein JRG19_03385 [Pseudoclavibacter alba]|uniref:hypothetical protein n=1 Tax=Pseudoclavibacter albus TaxID=272241 RepID=UPI0019D119C1|nr:hypothetical protein [Pseudoclavibacter alba]MBN6777594.1 hypothetical protein [Pseudoclavibacter alba]